MVYTVDGLRELLNSPINHDKWGNDTQNVLRIVHTILSSDCSSCMFRRKVTELNNILKKYGDSVASDTRHIKITSKGADHRRIPCPDCVSKHISQAFVLQSEFYQGYSDNLPLIEAHLYEAIEECPKDNQYLLGTLKTILRDILINKNPNIPIIAISDLLGTDSSPASSDVVCNVLSPDMLMTLVKRIPDEDLIFSLRMLEGLPEYTDYTDIVKRAEWSGRLACVSEILARQVPLIASEVRRRRMKYYDNPKNEQHMIQCSDILSMLSNEYNRRTNTNDYGQKRSED